MQESLFHLLVETASGIGYQDYGSTVKEVSWFSFSSQEMETRLKLLAANIRTFENAWQLLNQGHVYGALQKTIFALYFALQREKRMFPLFLAHLFYFPVLHVESMTTFASDLENMLTRTERKVDFLLDLLFPKKEKKDVIRDKENIIWWKIINGTETILHRLPDTSKNILSIGEQQLVRNHSVKVHHLYDQLFC